ncbi:hypothetical protein MTO96_021557 [Rhipicephalus appendiculatus]
MILRLRANETEEILAEFLRRENGPAALSELDVTNCVLLDPGKLPSLLVQCSYLTSLRCLGCGFRPSDFIAMLWRLRPLVEVEFSFMLETDVESELRRIGQAAAQYGSEPKASGLRRMYVEVGGNHIKFLPVLLQYCSYLHNLHVHFSCGLSWNAIRQCHDAVLTEDVSVETFTLTSEAPAPAQPEPRAPLDFTSCAAVCANVIYTKSTGSFNCVWLSDLADDETPDRPPRILPVQTILVAVQNTEEGIAEKSIIAASQRHNWEHVRQLCLLLPTVGACLRPATDGRRHVPRRPSRLLLHGA